MGHLLLQWAIGLGVFFGALLSLVLVALAAHFAKLWVRTLLVVAFLAGFIVVATFGLQQVGAMILP